MSNEVKVGGDGSHRGKVPVSGGRAAAMQTQPPSLLPLSPLPHRISSAYMENEDASFQHAARKGSPSSPNLSCAAIETDPSANVDPDEQDCTSESGGTGRGGRDEEEDASTEGSWEEDLDEET